MKSNSIYSVERLPNGLIKVFSYASKLYSCFNPDGTFRHGDLYPPMQASVGDCLTQTTLNETLAWLERDERAKA